MTPIPSPYPLPYPYPYSLTPLIPPTPFEVTHDLGRVMDRDTLRDVRAEIDRANPDPYPNPHPQP